MLAAYSGVNHVACDSETAFHCKLFIRNAFRFYECFPFFSWLSFLSVCLSVCLSDGVEFSKRNFTHFLTNWKPKIWNTRSFPTTIRYNFNKLTTSFLLDLLNVFLRVCLHVFVYLKILSRVIL